MIAQLDPQRIRQVAQLVARAQDLVAFLRDVTSTPRLGGSAQDELALLEGRLSDAHRAVTDLRVLPSEVISADNVGEFWEALEPGDRPESLGSRPPPGDAVAIQLVATAPEVAKELVRAVSRLAVGPPARLSDVDTAVRDAWLDQLQDTGDQEGGAALATVTSPGRVLTAMTVSTTEHATRRILDQIRSTYVAELMSASGLVLVNTRAMCPSCCIDLLRLLAAYPRLSATVRLWAEDKTLTDALAGPDEDGPGSGAVVVVVTSDVAGGAEAPVTHIESEPGPREHGGVLQLAAMVPPPEPEPIVADSVPIMAPVAEERPTTMEPYRDHDTALAGARPDIDIPLPEPTTTLGPAMNPHSSMSPILTVDGIDIDIDSLPPDALDDDEIDLRELQPSTLDDTDLDQLLALLPPDRTTPPDHLDLDRIDIETSPPDALDDEEIDLRELQPSAFDDTDPILALFPPAQTTPTVPPRSMVSSDSRPTESIRPPLFEPITPTEPEPPSWFSSPVRAPLDIPTPPMAESTPPRSGPLPQVAESAPIPVSPPPPALPPTPAPPPRPTLPAPTLPPAALKPPTDVPHYPGAWDAPPATLPAAETPEVARLIEGVHEVVKFLSVFPAVADRGQAEKHNVTLQTLAARVDERYRGVPDSFIAELSDEQFDQLPAAQGVQLVGTLGDGSLADWEARLTRVLLRGARLAVARERTPESLVTGRQLIEAIDRLRVAELASLDLVSDSSVRNDWQALLQQAGGYHGAAFATVPLASGENLTVMTTSDEASLVQAYVGGSRLPNQGRLPRYITHPAAANPIATAVAPPRHPDADPEKKIFDYLVTNQDERLDLVTNAQVTVVSTEGVCPWCCLVALQFLTDYPNLGVTMRLWNQDRPVAGMLQWLRRRPA